jgi:hypothetical protein
MESDMTDRFKIIPIVYRIQWWKGV